MKCCINIFIEWEVSYVWVVFNIGIDFEVSIYCDVNSFIFELCEWVYFIDLEIFLVENNFMNLRVLYGKFY